MTSVGQTKSSVSIPGVRNPDTSARFRGGKLRKTELSVQGDNTWKDVVRHEKLMIKMWNWKWDFLLTQTQVETRTPHPNFQTNESIENKLAKEGRRLGLLPWQNFEKRIYHIKPSPAFPPITSGIIGWRSAKEENSLELYKTKSRVPKIRFPDEQYGHYRKTKYLQTEARKNRSEPIISQSESQFQKYNGAAALPTKTMRHIVFPLLC